MTMMNEQQIAFAEQMRAGRLATVDQSGEAYIVPVCYAVYDDRFYTPIDEKPKRTDRPLKRVRNILQSGRASLLLDRYVDDDWSELAWMMVRGPAWIHQPGDDEHSKVIELLRQRYAQYRAMSLEISPLIVLQVDRITHWGALPV